MDNPSRELCTIIMSFGKLKYNRFHIGLKCSPDISQEIMENLFRHVEDTDVYIHGLGTFTQKGWENHIMLFDLFFVIIDGKLFHSQPL